MLHHRLAGLLSLLAVTGYVPQTFTIEAREAPLSFTSLTRPSVSRANLGRIAGSNGKRRAKRFARTRGMNKSQARR